MAVSYIISGGLGDYGAGAADATLENQTTIIAAIAALQTTADSVETDTQDMQTQIGTAGAGLSAIPVPSWALTSEEFWSEPVPASFASGEAGYVFGQLTGTTITGTNPVISSTTIELQENDVYNGTASPKLALSVSKDYTAADSVTLEIWRTGDAGARTTMKSATATVADATNINVASLDAGTWTSALTLDGCPAFEKLYFAWVADWSGNEETIAKGDCYVYGRE